MNLFNGILGAIPLATLAIKNGGMGQNIKSICALAFQGFLIMVCVGIYVVLIQSIATDGDPIGAIDLHYVYGATMLYII